MKISDQLKTIQSAFADWKNVNANNVKIAADIFDAFGILTAKPGGVVAIILFRSEDKRGEYEEAGQVDRKFWVVIYTGKSLQLNRGDQLTDGAAGGKPLYDLCEQAREIIRAIQFTNDSTEVTPNVLGIHPFEADGWLIAANYIEFTIGTQLPAVE